MPSESDPSTTSTTGQKWWKQNKDPVVLPAAAHRGQPCPNCLLADLDLDSLFRLRCPNCDYVADCGAFT